MTEPIATLAAWLAGHVEWMRHRPEADEFLADVETAARVVRGIARGPQEQKYLGPCGAQILHPEDGPCDRPYGDGPCDTCDVCQGDVYASRGSRTGRCRVCGAEVSTAERAAWLDAEVRSHAFRIVEIADAYGLRANTISVWLSRGQLVAHGHDENGRPLLNVGDVLDLAEADALRRHEAQQKRARRAAAQAAELESA